MEITTTGWQKFIEVSNQGNGHAQLSAATFISPDGTKKSLHPDY